MKKWLSDLTAVFFPQRNVCHLCGRGLAEAGEGYLCASCADELNQERISRYEMSSTEHPPIRLCVSAYWHQDEAKALVHLLKYGPDRAAAFPLAEGMGAAYAAAMAQFRFSSELIIPVPTTSRRISERGYNQASLLAEIVSAHLGLPLLNDVLVRGEGRSQVGRTREQRLKAMRGIFSITTARAIIGRRILLVDDVLTTGATSTTCAEALLAVGAAEVRLLTACKVS